MSQVHKMSTVKGQNNQDGIIRKILKISSKILVMIFILFVTVSIDGKAATYLDDLPITAKGQYEGNLGDSFVYKIGKHKYSRGNVDINGNVYTHGIEAWVARWNYTSEKSWAYATYNLSGKYSKLKGSVVLIKSYNTTNFDTTLYFYGDGKLIKKYRMTPQNIPFKISIDVSGVKKLKIYVKDNGYFAGGTSFGLVNMKLTKNQKDIKKAKVSAIGIYTYTGKSIQPLPRVVYNGKRLYEGRDYTLTYRNNVKVGKGKIIIKGKNGYKGTKTITFKIVKKK